MKAKWLLLLGAAAMLAAAPAFADWNPEQPYKWVQYPDLTSTGIDVNASTQPGTMGYILADDFQCTTTGPITGIHIWGSWYHDLLPGNSPRNVVITLSFHADIPDSESSTGYSMPGELLWVRTFQPTEFTVQTWASDLNEGWMNPPEYYEWPGDHVCYQYNFFIDPDEAFVQEGTNDDPVVYWLDVQAVPQEQERYFGWKTSQDHWNDDAVYGRGEEPYSGPWGELIYPPGHQQEGESIDLAFVIVGEEGPQDVDFGDAPEDSTTGSYPTTLLFNGARHIIGGPWLGDDNDNPDPEPDGQPDINAKGDDINDGNDDEDGVNIPILYQGQSATITMEVNGGGGVVEAWLDFDGSSTWEASEIIYSGWLADGTHSFNITPTGAFIGSTFARFRISGNGGLTWEGEAPDGEVEDYEVFIRPEPQELDFGDAPLNPVGGGYPTVLPDGARHVIAGPWFGDDNDAPDAESDGQPDPGALGDDTYDLNDDEDGVVIPVMMVGQVSTITYQVNGGGGVVTAWVDWNGDYSWDASEQIVNSWQSPGFHAVNVTPPGPYVGQTFARFRITTMTMPIGPEGQAEDGEVEDHEVWIEEQPDELDFGDAPEIPGGTGYPTTLPNGARHVIGGPFFDDPSGAGLDAPDPETDGQPEANALGDDTFDLNDDEDGVQIPLLTPGVPGDIEIFVNNTAGVGGFVEAWIDFDADYMWQAGEQIFAGWLPNGSHLISVTPPLASAIGQTFGRFRISNNGGLPPGGPAPDGEVEDHEVWIEEPEAFKWIQLPDLTIYGIDVNATEAFILADDFQCTEPGYITDIYVWASWKYDYLPFGEDPLAVAFTLSFHEDIPDSMSPGGYSMPGDVKWYRDFGPAEFEARIWRDGIEEGWMDPPEAWFFPGDTVCWLYKFQVPQTEAFRQEGTEDRPLVYWLDVQARPEDMEAFFGWKTTRENWNDAAVWGMGIEPYPGPWDPLSYPPGHEMSGQPIDLAFALKAIPVTDVPDEFGMSDGFRLEQNVPNPFNPVTEILFEIPATGRVALEVFDVQGHHVRTLVDAVKSGGSHVATWDGRDAYGREVSTGVYFYRLTAEGFEATRKMLLLK